MFNHWIGNRIEQFQICSFNSEICCFDFKKVIWICINIYSENGNKTIKSTGKQPIVPTCWRKEKILILRTTE
jgi:hypothetical protein